MHVERGEQPTGRLVQPAFIDRHNETPVHHPIAQAALLELARS
jgi:hypothetical protein